MADLNTSDHLPIAASMLENLSRHRGDWGNARKTGKVAEYVQEVCLKLTPLLCNV